MSADPFRDIVKQNAHLYRDAEETRIKSTEKKCREYIEWKKDQEVYRRALETLKVTAGQYEDQIIQ